MQESADDLNQDFVVERVGVSDSETEEQAPRAKVKIQKPMVGNSKRQQISFADLGIELDELECADSSIVTFLDKLYLHQPKPLFVKTHTKVKVLIACSSALRALEIIKDLKGMNNVKVCKLFAKHMKIKDQIKSLKESNFLIGVGTPGRILKILETDEEAMPLKKMEFLIIDGSHKDKKSFSILDLPETHMDLKKLVEMLRDSLLGVYNY
jgi:hypothetical protein